MYRLICYHIQISLEQAQTQIYEMDYQYKVLAAQGYADAVED